MNNASNWHTLNHYVSIRRLLWLKLEIFRILRSQQFEAVKIMATGQCIDIWPRLLDIWVRFWALGHLDWIPKSPINFTQSASKYISTFLGSRQKLLGYSFIHQKESRSTKFRFFPQRIEEKENFVMEKTISTILSCDKPYHFQNANLTGWGILCANHLKYHPFLSKHLLHSLAGIGINFTANNQQSQPKSGSEATVPAHHNGISANLQSG